MSREQPSTSNLAPEAPPSGPVIVAWAGWKTRSFAAIVNGIMFIVGGIMISRPGVRIGSGIEAGLEPKSLDLAQHASLPLLAALVIALVLSFFMKETYPKS